MSVSGEGMPAAGSFSIPCPPNDITCKHQETDDAPSQPTDPLPTTDGLACCPPVCPGVMATLAAWVNSDQAVAA